MHSVDVVFQRNVLFAMANTSAVDSQTSQPRVAVQPCNVYDTVLNRFLPGA